MTVEQGLAWETVRTGVKEGTIPLRDALELPEAQDLHLAQLIMLTQTEKPIWALRIMRALGIDHWTTVAQAPASLRTKVVRECARPRSAFAAPAEREALLALR